MTRTHRILMSLAAMVLVGAGVSGQAIGAETRGVGKGETSQQKSQQGIGLDNAGSSGVIVGGPEIIIGKIGSIKGDEYTLEGDRGQMIRLRVTKDTNIVCAEGEGAKMSTSREGVKERHEIPVSPATEEQMKSHDQSKADDQRQALNDPNQQQTEHVMGAPAKDPSKLKDVVGSTDEKANQDIARGSGFVVGGSSGCQFKPGDLVRVEASDMGTATTIKGLSSSDPARSEIAEGAMEPQDAHDSQRH
jgi:hypothetical protein